MGHSAVRGSLRWEWACACLIAFGAASDRPLSAQIFLDGGGFDLSGPVQLPEAGNEALALLTQVDAFIAESQWDEAVETLRNLIETHGDRLVAVGEGRFLSLREHGHQRIARLPAPALALYRQRVDPVAGRWYEEGYASRDPVRLGRVVDTFFCSTWGDDALLALGEMALARGEYDAARRHWERISPLLRGSDGLPLWWPARPQPSEDAGEDRDADPPLHFACPDTDLDLAEVRARLVLVSIREGALKRAEYELELLRARHPDARGRLGGRDVALVGRLTSLLDEARRWPATEARRDWPTFGGGPRRTRPTARAVVVGVPVWRVPLGSPRTAESAGTTAVAVGGRRVGEDVDRLLSYHPVVSDDLLLVSDERRILAFDLATGRPAWGRDNAVIYHDELPDLGPSRHSRRRQGVPRFTLSAHDNLLLARMGEPTTSWSAPDQPGRRGGYLVCLDLARQGWIQWKRPPDGPEWAYEGTPLCDGDHVYVAMRRSGARPQSHVACLDARTGRLEWRRFVCGASTLGQGRVDEVTHNLLTLAEGTLYFNTNLGAVASLRARDGHLNWVRLYERGGRGELTQRAAHYYRDLNPCIFHRGMLLVAPSEVPNVFALDAATGQVLWDSPHLTDAVHLLGVVEGHLVASGDRLWWLKVDTGELARFPWPENRKSGLRGIGRGTIAGSEVLWPTRKEIQIFDARTTALKKTLPIELHGVPAGNLIVAGGHLLVVGADAIHGFSQVVRRRPQLEREVTESPDDPRAHYRLAQCEEALDALDDALARYDRVLALSDADTMLDGESLRVLAAERRFALLVQRARSRAEARDWEAALEYWTGAADVALDAPGRVFCRWNAALALEAAGRNADAMRAWNAVRGDPQASALQVPREPGRTLSASLVAAERAALVANSVANPNPIPGEKPNTHPRDGPFPGRLDSDDSESSDPRAADAPALEPNLAGGTRLTGGTPAEIRLPLKEAWRREVGGPLFVPEGDDGLLVAIDHDDVVAIDVVRGTPRWTTAIMSPKGPLEGPPVWADLRGEQLLVASARRLVALNAADGAVQWHRESPARELAAPVRHRDRILAIEGDSAVVAVDVATGRVVGRYAPPHGARLGPTLYLHGDHVLIQEHVDREPSEAAARLDRLATHTVVLRSADAGLAHRVAPIRLLDVDARSPADLRPADLRPPRVDAAWRRPPTSAGPGRVVVVADRVALIDVASGRVVWTRDGGSPGLPPRVVADADRIVIVSDDRRAMAVDPETGADRWPAPAPLAAGAVRGAADAALIDGPRLYWTAGGQIEAIDLDTGRPSWRTTVAREAAEAEQPWRVARWPASRGTNAGVDGPIACWPEPHDLLAVTLIDPATGRMLYRSAARGATAQPARVHLQPGRALVLGIDRVWALSP